MFIVTIDNNVSAWGPFATPEDAQEFADFVTQEVDPARVRKLNTPWGELLTWREMRLQHERNYH